MEVKAKTKFIRMSSRKAALVINPLRRLSVEEAEKILRFTNKAAAKEVEKILRSALANAENNFKLSKSNLFIKEITVGQGPSLKRWRPRAFGRAAPIRKHTCHLKIVLAERETKKK